jgi:hypothetical protein
MSAQVDVVELFNEIRRLPHWRSFSCSCGGRVHVHALQIYAKCSSCGTSIKCRCFGGWEVQDLIDAVLQWAGEGQSFDAFMLRRQEILADEPLEWPFEPTSKEIPDAEKERNEG